MSFSIKSDSTRNFPSFNKPEAVGYFSLNGVTRNYSEDLYQLKYFKDINKKQVNFDLNHGLNQVIRKPSNLNEKLDFILRWIINNHKKILDNTEQKKWLYKIKYL